MTYQFSLNNRDEQTLPYIFCIKDIKKNCVTVFHLRDCISACAIQYNE